jgi:hypothetical protein
VRIYLLISLSGLLLLWGMTAIFFLLQDGLGGLIFLYLASYWTAGCAMVGLALVIATGLQRFASRFLKPS